MRRGSRVKSFIVSLCKRSQTAGRRLSFMTCSECRLDYCNSLLFVVPGLSRTFLHIFVNNKNFIVPVSHVPLPGYRTVLVNLSLLTLGGATI